MRLGELAASRYMDGAGFGGVATAAIVCEGFTKANVALAHAPASTVGEAPESAAAT